MKTPAAMARIAMMIGKPAKEKLSNAINPYKMSQMASKSIPIFFVIFMMMFLSSANDWKVQGKRLL
jgi:hypothetical protein